jgi:hypothetical protein
VPVPLGKHGREVLGPMQREAAAAKARELSELVGQLKAEGKGVRELAVALNERGIPAPRGAKWHPTSVQRLPRRLREPYRPARH